MAGARPDRLASRQWARLSESDLPLFSVICMVRNRAPLIRKCVESVLAQDDPAVELVVQDGASSDGTLEILREYGDRIRLVSEPDAGAGDGLFRALRRARGVLGILSLGRAAGAGRRVLGPAHVRRAPRARRDLRLRRRGRSRGHAAVAAGRRRVLARGSADLSPGAAVCRQLLPDGRLPAGRTLGLHRRWRARSLVPIRGAIPDPPVSQARRLLRHGPFDVVEPDGDVSIGARSRGWRRCGACSTTTRPAGPISTSKRAPSPAIFFGTPACSSAWASGIWRVSRFDQARAYWPACADDWLEDGDARVTLLERHLTAEFTNLPTDQFTNSLRSHLRSPSAASCAEGLRFLPAEAERSDGLAALHRGPAIQRVDGRGRHGHPARRDLRRGRLGARGASAVGVRRADVRRGHREQREHAAGGDDPRSIFFPA